MLTILLLACKSDQGLQNNNQNPGRSLDQEACECTDNTADVTALQEELDSLRNRVVTLESAPAPEPEPVPEVPPSALVVTEYEVMCTAGRDSDGNVILQDPLTASYPSGETFQVGCRVAMIDPGDRPFIINVGTLWDYSLDEEGSPYRSWLPDARPGFTPFHIDALGIGTNTLIMPDGTVIVESSFAGVGSVYSADAEEFIDLPVRVVIFDDKPALRPEAW